MKKFRLYFIDSDMVLTRELEYADLFAFLDSLVTRYHQKTGSILFVKEVDWRDGRVLLKFGSIMKPELLQKIFNGL